MGDLFKPSAPPPPDYAGLARQQGQESRDTAVYNNAINRVNQVGPTGSTTWSIRPGADPNNPRPGDYIQTTALSPGQQALQNSSDRISQSFANTAESGLSRVSQGMNEPFSTHGLPALSTLNNQGLPSLDYGTQGSRGRVEQALLARINPDLDRQQAQLDNRLLNSGIERGSDAWAREQELMGRQRNDAVNQAILAGGAEESRLAGLQMGQRGQLFGENQAIAGQGNQARQQGIQEQAYLRSLPLNEVNALRTGAQVQSPQFQSYYTGGNAQAAPVLDAGLAQGQYNTNLFNTQMQGSNALLGGLVNLGGAAFLGMPPGRY